jgi:ATP-binding cassette subfamily F protein 3
VGIVGPNGAGKTSLLQVLLGRMRPTEGLVELGYQVHAGYLDQKLSRGLDLGRSLVDEVRGIRPDLTIEGARDALARYRFLGEDVFKTVGALSGGERCRLSLLKLSLKPHNLLVLDEPTNHLDIPAREVLERALSKYPGTLLVISHDREFLDKVVEKVLWVEAGNIHLFEGNWSEARRKMRSGDAVVGTAFAKPDPPAAPSDPEPKTDQRQATKERRRKQTKAKNRLAQLEKDIAEFEGRLEVLTAELQKNPEDWERLHDLAKEEQTIRTRLDRRYQEWERVSEAVED